MGTNSYVSKLKARLDRAIIQRDHWKQLAENRNSIVVTEVCQESRSVEEYIIDADSVRASWRLIRRHREQIEALRLQNAMFVTAAANIDREREALRAELVAARKQEPVASVVSCYVPSGKRVALNTEYQNLPVGTQLYTLPPASPDVEGLVKALSTFVALGVVPGGWAELDTAIQEANAALSTWRQAQEGKP